MKISELEVVAHHPSWKPLPGRYKIQIIRNRGVRKTKDYGQKLILHIGKGKNEYLWYIHYENPTSEGSTLAQLKEIFGDGSGDNLQLIVDVSGLGRARKYKVSEYVENNLEDYRD